MKNKVYFAALMAICLLASDVAAKRILFFEIGTGQYTIERDYSKFAEELRRRNYEVASIEKGELAKEKLENYDILVVQDLNKQLTTQEISAIIWFVLQKGKGLFINGGGQGRANQLTIPFGVTVDNGMLIDTSDQIPALNDRNSFMIDRFMEQSGMTILRQGVSRVGFYKDSGLITSGNSKCIASGNGDTYSDTGSFAAGSQPCIAAASIFGGGLVMTLSDADMLSDKYIDEYNNKNLGLNIVDWLSIATENVSFENSTQELQLVIKNMRLNELRLNQSNEILAQEKRALDAKNADLANQVLELQTELNNAEEGMLGPFSQSSWAFIILGLCCMGAAYIYSQKRGGEPKIKDEDILSELGYELDSAGGQQAAGQKAAELDSDDDLKGLKV